jgi:hypothetical protein
MLTNAALFERELGKLIEETINDLRGQLEINNYETVGEFRYVMGRIAALRSVMEELVPLAKDYADQRNR